MKKLVKGIVEFRRNIRPNYLETFAKLALGQSPDTLFIACSDSRVVPNLFASTDPGDLFVVRNVGNIVPPCHCHGTGLSRGDKSEAAAIEFAVHELKISNIIVCGHSECGAMRALLDKPNEQMPNLTEWLTDGKIIMDLLNHDDNQTPELAKHNRLSQLNVLQQLENLKTYPIVQQKLQEGKLKLHGWWFELRHAEVYAYEEEIKQFVLIDEVEAEKILERIDIPQ
ncbi:MAG: carbonic anhydrase [Candidatus Berkiella sp.]